MYPELRSVCRDPITNLWSLPASTSERTLSSWLENMDKLDSLTSRLQKLASSAPPEHRAQLLNKVQALRATFKRQQERFIEFLQLSEEYANKYLFNISTEIQQQRTVLDNLGKRLEAANKLHEEAVDLQTFYESETVATMKDLRTTGKAVPCCLQRRNTET
jgi:acyl carrier protein phosphodiesterase